MKVILGKLETSREIKPKRVVIGKPMTAIELKRARSIELKKESEGAE